MECFKCSNVEMVPVKLEYTKYVQMSGEERENYVESWMYIHSKRRNNVIHESVAVATGSFLTIYSYNKFREEVCQFEKCAAYIKSDYG